MKQERRRFTKEFKLNAFELSYLRSNFVKLANELEVRPELLYQRISEFASFHGKSFPGNEKPKMIEQETEIARLKKELKEIEMMCDILKMRSASFLGKMGNFIGL